jgi:hypothetical protein
MRSLVLGTLAPGVCAGLVCVCGSVGMSNRSLTPRQRRALIAALTVREMTPEEIRAALTHEREQLVARIAEIDEALERSA